MSSMNVESWKAMYNHDEIYEVMQINYETTEKLTQQLKEAEEAIGFYADTNNWGAFDFIPNDGESFYQGHDGEKDIFIIQAGKKAREYKKKWSK